MKLITVIVNYKTAEMTIRSVESALREMPASGVVMVVDNDSKDGSFAAISKAALERGWGARVEVLASDRNGGFGYGNNFAIKRAFASADPPEYVYLLNSDAFPDPGGIQKLIAFMDLTPRAGITGSYLHGPNGEPQTSAFTFPSLYSELDQGLRLGIVSRMLEQHIVSKPRPKETAEVDWLAGASMMIRSSMLREIGLFDETFFLYYEETDLCRRAREAGWSCWYVPESSVEHWVSVSTGLGDVKKRMPTYWFDSREHYFKKSHGESYLLAVNLAWLAGYSTWRVRRVIQRKPVTDPPRTLRDFVAHAFKLPKFRS